MVCNGPAGGDPRSYRGLTVDPTRSAALGGPRERRFVGPAAGPHGGAHAFRRPHGGHPSAHSPRAPCSSSTDAPAWPKPDLSPPTDFDGDGILALFALAAGACREGTSGGVPCLTGDGTAGACREGKGGKVLLPRRGGGVAGVGRGGTSGGGATQARRG